MRISISPLRSRARLWQLLAEQSTCIERQQTLIATLDEVIDAQKQHAALIEQANTSLSELVDAQRELIAVRDFEIQLLKNPPAEA